VLPACGGSGPGLELAFADEVVGARARSALVHVLEGASCEEAFARPASEVGRLRAGGARGTTPYPARPEDVLPSAPTGDGAIHVAARDAEGRVMARGCVPVEGGSWPPTVELRALPPCEASPTALDLAVIYDASEAMWLASSQLLDPAQVFVESFLQAADFPPATRFSLYAFGTQPAREVLGPVAEASALADAVVDLEYGGPADLFRATFEAAQDLRDRAACGKLPAVMAYVAGETAIGAAGAHPRDALFALAADDEDRADDIFAFGVGVTQVAVEDLSAAIPEPGRVRGGSTQSSARAALRQASLQIRARIQLP
jgi:hypothetical protein